MKGHWLDELLTAAEIERGPAALRPKVTERDLWAAQWQTDRLLGHTHTFVRAVAVCIFELRSRGMSDQEIGAKLREMWDTPA